MRIAIVDDLETHRKRLYEQIQIQLSRHALDAQITQYENCEAFLNEAAKENFEVVFLDIYMNGMSGVEAAKKLRTTDKECIIIFTTASADHALEGFRVRALDYLVKPYSDEEIENLFEEILRRLPVPDKYIDIRVVGGNVRLRLSEIVFAEHFRHQIHIHNSDDKTTVTRQTIAQFTSQLCGDERFFLCSRGVIVNMEYAKDFNGTEFILKNGRTISVSRDNSKTARAAFGDFLFKRGYK